MKRARKRYRHRSHSSDEDERRLTKRLARFVGKELKRKRKKTRRHRRSSSTSSSSSDGSYGSGKTRSYSPSERKMRYEIDKSSNLSRSSSNDGHDARSRERHGISPKLIDKAADRGVEAAAVAAGTAATAGQSSDTLALDGAHVTASTATHSRIVAETEEPADASPPRTDPVSPSAGQQEQEKTTKTAHNEEHNQETSKDIPVLLEKSLKDHIVNVIGQPLRKERQVAPPMHSMFVERWAEVLRLGLPKDERVELIKKFPPPENCGFLQPPKLNKEISLSLNEICKNRDQRIVAKQEKMQACIGGLAQILTSLLLRDLESDLPMIETLCGVVRLVIDAMHDETAIRRSLILANTNVAVKDTLSATEADELLFGKNLSENLKQAKVTGQDVRILAKKPPAQTPKNQKPPPRHQSGSQTSAPRGHQRSESKNQTNQRSRQGDRTQSTEQTPHKSFSKKHYPKRHH